jgi:hypothetical protein
MRQWHCLAIALQRDTHRRHGIGKALRAKDFQQAFRIEVEAGGVQLQNANGVVLQLSRPKVGAEVFGGRRRGYHYDAVAEFALRGS